MSPLGPCKIADKVGPRLRRGAPGAISKAHNGGARRCDDLSPSCSPASPPEKTGGRARWRRAKLQTRPNSRPRCAAAARMLGAIVMKQGRTDWIIGQAKDLAERRKERRIAKARGIRVSSTACGCQCRICAEPSAACGRSGSSRFARRRKCDTFCAAPDPMSSFGLLARVIKQAPVVPSAAA